VLCGVWRVVCGVCHASSQGNHIYTSGATGTNAAVIKGALRAEAPDLLTVILPQSLSRQPQESQELLAQVGFVGGWGWQWQHVALPSHVCAVIAGPARLPQPHLPTEVPMPVLRLCLPGAVQVTNIIEMPHNDELSLLEASRCVSRHSVGGRRGAAKAEALLSVKHQAAPNACCCCPCAPCLVVCPRHCNREIIGKVQQVICFAFHDSRLLLETCAEAKDSKKIVTLFYLD
jgi:hypothetical protein